MNRSILAAFLAGLVYGAPLTAQNKSTPPEPMLHINSPAVLVDVIVTGRDGKPVTGLKKDDFSIREQGKTQHISFFEEHRGLDSNAACLIQFPELPPDTFSNFTPIPPPPAVNILLLDALNTPQADQMYLRKSVENYLKTVKPGSRIAIFTMAMKLSFIEGFADDPAVLAAAMGYRKNQQIEATPLIQSQAETNAQNSLIGMMKAPVGMGGTAGSPGMADSLQQFMAESQDFQVSYRANSTLDSLRQLATYLSAFPGRKNLIWLSSEFPLNLAPPTKGGALDDRISETIALLAAARVAIYPVDVRGAWIYTSYTAEKNLGSSISQASQLSGPNGAFAGSILNENRANNGNQLSMDMLAEATGGKAFYNRNNLGEIIDTVVSGSNYFYTLSYSPTNKRMDGAFRNIVVKLKDSSYRISYRRGYYARPEGLPGEGEAFQSYAVPPNGVDLHGNPLQPFMDFGLPQNDQILYKLRIVPTLSNRGTAGAKPGKAAQQHYSIDFAVDVRNLDLKLDSDGLHKGMLNVSLIVYDKYGQIVSREDHLAQVQIKPDVWTVSEQIGLQLHAEIDVPKGQYWLRTGVYDRSTHKVGTLQVPFSSVHFLQASARASQRFRFWRPGR